MANREYIENIRRDPIRVPDEIVRKLNWAQKICEAEA
jgi:hypothetical protein